MLWPKFSKGERRRITIFLSSLAAAVFLWLFYSLSNRYTYPLRFAIVWTDAPQNQQFSALQPDSVFTKVEGSGWQLIFDKIKTNTQKLNISQKNLQQNSFIELKSLLPQLNRQLASNQKIINIMPDTLFFEQADLVTKRVPVKLFHQIQFETAYGLAGPIVLSPAFVTLSGKAADLNQIQFIETEILRNNEVNTHFKQWLNLKNSLGKQIQVYPEQILVKVPVSSYTEKVMNLDIQIRNNSKQQKLKIFPGQVKITFSTALSNYPLVKPEDFEAFVDLELWQTKKISQLPIKFGRLPSFIKIIKIEPQNIDFIIYP